MFEKSSADIIKYGISRGLSYVRGSGTSNQDAFEALSNALKEIESPSSPVILLSQSEYNFLELSLTRSIPVSHCGEGISERNFRKYREDQVKKILSFFKAEVA